MSNSTATDAERGLCPPPFLDQANFRNDGGHLSGRLCSPLQPGLTCCLPCPATDWIYAPNFLTWYYAAEALSAIGLVISCFLLVSWAVLPVEKTRRHYLSISLVIGIFFESLAFVIPLGAHPSQCHNDITPNDMYSDLPCAFSGALVVAGGLSVSMWIMIRAVSMHLQICWNIVPGRKFFFASLICGWGLVAIIFTITMKFTGVSYRFGPLCHVNSNKSMADFWGPLLGIAGIAALVQILTFMYCIKVYLSNMLDDGRTRSNDSADLPSYNGTTRTTSARAVYQRVKEVLRVQWRSITIVVFLLVDIIFFAVVWIQLDTSVRLLQQGKVEHVLPFLFCLIASPDDRSKCYAAGQAALVNESTSVAILMLLSLTGIQTGLTLCRTSMFGAWLDLIKKKIGSKREFVSLDAKRFSTDPRTIELLKVNANSRVDTGDTGISRVETFESKDSKGGTFSTTPRYGSYQQSQNSNSPPQPRHSSQAERQYTQPRMSFSRPRERMEPELEQRRPTWDPTETFATAGPNNPAIGSIASINGYTTPRTGRGQSPNQNRDRFGNRMI